METKSKNDGNNANCSAVFQITRSSDIFCYALLTANQNLNKLKQIVNWEVDICGEVRG